MLFSAFLFAVIHLSSLKFSLTGYYSLIIGFSQVSAFISLNSWFHIKVPQQCAYILTFRFVGSAVVREIRTKRNNLIKIDLLEIKWVFGMGFDDH